MAQTSWPFENIDTTEVQFSQWARHINEGIRPDFANELEPFADDSGLNVKVKSGQAMVRGHYYASTAEETLTITTPDATNPRIDSVVLELDIVANSILLKVVAGTPAGSPVAPTLTQSEDGNVYQFLLGNVAVAAGVFSIAAGDVTDLRTYMFQGVGKWTTATRPANPIDYQTIGYNTDLNTHEVWNGTAWTSVFAPITTEGDLAIGDNTGTAVRLPIGAADTVLTSNGTTATWQDAGGGGLTLINMPFEDASTFDFAIGVGQQARFSIITTSTDPFTINLVDSSDTLVEAITVDRDNPFTYVAPTSAVAKIAFLNNVVDETAILAVTNPSSAENPTVIDTIVMTSTQSVTISKSYTAFVFGGGAAGGGSGGFQGSSAGGGGAGYFSTGTLSAGTYTATIGAGGAGSTAADGADGGTSSIGAISALGGSGGIATTSTGVGGDGGDGGSGGGGGAGATGQAAANGGTGGSNGNDGTAGDGNGTNGAVGTGSAVTIDSFSFPAGFLINTTDFYTGGDGGDVTGGSQAGQNATEFGGGGAGAEGEKNSPGSSLPGGNGKAGYILLVEA